MEVDGEGGEKGHPKIWKKVSEIKKEKSTFNLYRLYLYTFIFNKRELKSPPTKFHIHSIHTFIHDVFKSKEKCIPLLRRKKYKGFLYIISGLVD